MLTILSDPVNLLTSSSYTQGGTVRWMSPELIIPHRFGFEKSRRTKSSDCYAFGMVIYETISGKLPFHKDMDLSVCVKVVEGERPLRGTRFTENLWRVVELCWAPQPNNRPNIEDVLQRLELVPNSYEQPPGVDEGTEDRDDWDSGTETGFPGDTISERSTVVSPGTSYPTDHPLSPVPTPSLSPIILGEANGDIPSGEATDPGPSKSQTGSGSGSARQVSAIPSHQSGFT